MKWMRKNFIFTLLLLLVVSSLTGCQSKEVNSVESVKEGKTATSKIAEAISQIKPQINTKVETQDSDIS